MGISDLFAPRAPRPGSDGDAAVLARVRAGDADAIRDLVRRHHGALVQIADGIVRNRALAEDVAQETWIAVIDGIGGFDGRSALITWIVAILVNKARSHARREGRYVALADDGGRDADRPAVPSDRFGPDGHWSVPPARLDGLDPERIVAGRELWRHVGAVIETLPPGQKAVLVLRDVEGRSSAETCRLLGIGEENQRVLLHRARARVRQAVEDLLGGTGHGEIAQA